MAYFGVTFEEIATIAPIEGADKIEKATLKDVDFQFVVPKNIYSIGETVVYFPIDSVLPEKLIGVLGLTGKLSGKDKNRVKTVRLRGELSQGIVAKLSAIYNSFGVFVSSSTDKNKIGEELANFLGVTKFEPPAILCKNANLLPLPLGLSAYDIEGCERNANILQLFNEVVVTEKLEGMNFSASISKLDGKVYVNQRNFTIEEKGTDDRHTFWLVAERQGIIAFAKKMSEKYGESVTVYGEMLGPGIQGNIYNLPEHTVFLFDIKVGNRFLNANEFLEECSIGNMKIAPVLFIGHIEYFLKGKTPKEAANGESKLFPTLREGIVIKPVKEDYVERFGRLLLKQRCPIYLSKNEN